MYFYEDDPEEVVEQGEPQGERASDPITQGVIEAIREESEGKEKEEEERQAEQSQRKEEEKEDKSLGKEREDSPVGSPGEKQKPPLGNQEGGPKPDAPKPDSPESRNEPSKNFTRNG